MKLILLLILKKNVYNLIYILFIFSRATFYDSFLYACLVFSFDIPSDSLLSNFIYQNPGAFADVGGHFPEIIRPT